MAFRDQASFHRFGVRYDAVFDCSVVGTCATREPVVDAIVNDPVRRILGDLVGEDAEIVEHQVTETERRIWSHHVVQFACGDGVECASNFVVYEDRNEDHAMLVLDSVLADELHPIQKQFRSDQQVIDWHAA